MYRGDLSRDGHPSTATLNIGDAQRLTLSWRAGMVGAIDGTPVVSAGVVVAGSQGGRLAAYNASTGVRLWEQSGLGPISSSPAIDGNRVFASTLSGHVRAFDLGSGRQVWDWQASGQSPAIWSSPAIYGGHVLIGIASQAGDKPLEVGRMVALDATSGAQVWSVCVRDACEPGGGIWSTPAVDSAGRAFVGIGNPDDGVLAFNASTGARLWKYSFYSDDSRDLDVGASPVLLNVGGREAVAVGSDGGIFKVLDASTGSAIWSDDLVIGSAVHGLIASPAYDGTNLYVASASPPTGVFALAPGDGKVTWRHQTELPIYSSPAVGRGVVLVGTGAVFGDLGTGSIVALASADGAVLWTYKTHAAVRSSPAMAGNLVVVGDSGGDLLAFRPP